MLAETLAGTRHEAATTGSADTTSMGQTRAITGTTDHRQPEPSGPRAVQEAWTGDNKDALPTPPTGLRRRQFTEDAGTRATGEAEDENREGQDR